MLQEFQFQFSFDVLEGPVNGVLSELDETYSYTPNIDFNGFDSLKYVICDNDVNCSKCDSAWVLIKIKDVPNLPTGDDSLIVISTDGTVTDPRVLIYDPDIGDKISIDSVLTPRGKVVINIEDSTIIYVPKITFINGCDDVTVYFSDMTGNVDSLTITYVIENEAPVAITDYIEVNQGEGFELDVRNNDYDPDNNTLQTINIIQYPGYASSFEKLNDSSIYYQPEVSYTGVDQLIYEVCDDAESCESTAPLCDTALVNIFVNPLKVIPNQGVSASNNDGVNDTWVIENIHLYPDNNVRLYNRWGNLIWERDDYDNETIVWDGKSNVGGISIGSQLPDGTYFYTIQLNDEDDSVYNGFLILK